MDKVFLICPDCYIEQVIRDKYGEDSYFLTALGTVFTMEEFETAEEINQFLIKNEVTYMYLVNDFSCTFLQNAINNDLKFNTTAELKLSELIQKNKQTFEQLTTDKEKAIKLARLNIYRQAYGLLETAFLGNKIEDGEILLKGLIYDRQGKTFTEMDIKL